MPDNDSTNLEELGSFDIEELKRLLAALEASGLPFEIEGPESGFGRVPMRTYDNPPSGPKLKVLIPASKLAAAQAVVQKLYPV